jgi:aspartyl-tRNA synthetase
MAIQEQLMHAAILAVKEQHGEEILKHFGIEVQVPSIPFPRVTLHDAIDIIKERGHTVERGGDLDPEGERQIAAWAEETHGHEFVFVTDYPATTRRLPTAMTSSGAAPRSPLARSASTVSMC